MPPTVTETVCAVVGLLSKETDRPDLWYVVF